MNIPEHEAIHEQTWRQRNSFFIFVASWSFLTCALFAAFVFCAVNWARAENRADEAYAAVFDRNLSCDELMKDPVVKRIMGANRI